MRRLWTRKARASLVVAAATASRTGEHDVNQDATGESQVAPFFLRVLADGLGGHQAGELASGLVVDTCTQAFRDRPSVESAALELLVHAAHRAISRSEAGGGVEGGREGMRSTVVLLASDGVVARWAHVGDSRAYHFRGGGMVQRTRDHSVPEMLFRTGEIGEAEIRGHPDRSRLLQALGQEGPPRVAVSDLVHLEPGDVFLLCSDGWWEQVTEAQMTATLQRTTAPEEWLCAMLDGMGQADTAEPRDNFTATAVWMG